MIIIKVIGIIILVILFVAELTCYLTHLDMVQSEDKELAWGSFKDFKKMFCKRTWERHGRHKTSWFQPYNSLEYKNWYVHADIIIFDGIGMKLYPWSYIAFQIWSLKGRNKTVTDKHIYHEWK